MQTQILSGEQALTLAAELIREGQVVAFPTETVYGLGADATNPQAVARIYEAKGRPSDNPLIVHVADKQSIRPLVRQISEQAQIVMDRFMPGPITVILPRAACVPDAVTAGLDTVGIRMPEHPVARDFLRTCGKPIAAPSANRSSHISPTTAQHVYEDLQGRIPLIIDGGACSVGIESTIVDLSGETPIILRPGAITEQMLADALGTVQTFRGKVVVARAPGMKYKHYSPKCPMLSTTDCARAIDAYDRLVEQDKHPLMLCSSQWVERIGTRRHIDLGPDPQTVMRNIYGAMHAAEGIADTILCQDFGDEGVYGSVMNRVRKACGGNTL